MENYTLSRENCTSRKDLRTSKAYSNAMKALQTKIVSLEANLESQKKNNVQIWQGKCEELSVQLSQSQELCMFLKEQNQSMRKDLQDLINENDSLKFRHELAIREIHSEIDSIKLHYEDIIHQNQRDIENMKKYSNKLEISISELKGALESKDKHIRILQSNFCLGEREQTIKELEELKKKYHQVLSHSGDQSKRFTEFPDKLDQLASLIHEKTQVLNNLNTHIQ